MKNNILQAEDCQSNYTTSIKKLDVQIGDNDLIKYVFDKQSEGVGDMFKRIENTIVGKSLTSQQLTHKIKSA